MGKIRQSIVDGGLLVVVVILVVVVRVVVVVDIVEVVGVVGVVGVTVEDVVVEGPQNLHDFLHLTIISAVLVVHCPAATS